MTKVAVHMDQPIDQWGWTEEGFSAATSESSQSTHVNGVSKMIQKFLKNVRNCQKCVPSLH